MYTIYKRSTCTHGPPVVHHEQLQVLDVGDHKPKEARGQHVAGGLVGAIANVGHDNGALEPAWSKHMGGRKGLAYDGWAAW